MEALLFLLNSEKKKIPASLQAVRKLLGIIRFRLKWKDIYICSL